VIVDGEVHNDQSVELLRAHRGLARGGGADVVAPSDMMDGRVEAIREALDDRSFESTPILAYPRSMRRRSTGRSRGGRLEPAFETGAGYQMDPANVREALRECELDIDEGADAVMIKPALPYLDVIRACATRSTFRSPRTTSPASMRW